MKGKFISEILGENVSYPGKKYPDPDRPEIKFPDPDRPEIKFPDPKIFFKMFPDPGQVSVRSGETRGFGLPRRSLIQMHYVTIVPCKLENIVKCAKMDQMGFFSQFLMGGGDSKIIPPRRGPSVTKSDGGGGGNCEKNPTEAETARLLQN